MNILIVEDSKAIQDTYSDSIRFYYHTKTLNKELDLNIKTVSSIKEYFGDKTPFNHIDLAIIDWFLLGGDTAKQIIREIKDLCPYMVIITGSPNNPDVQKCADNCGVKAIIGKPVDYYMLEMLFGEVTQNTG